MFIAPILGWNCACHSALFQRTRYEVIHYLKYFKHLALKRGGELNGIVWALYDPLSVKGGTGRERETHHKEQHKDNIVDQRNPGQWRHRLHRRRLGFFKVVEGAEHEEADRDAERRDDEHRFPVALLCQHDGDHRRDDDHHADDDAENSCRAEML